MNRSRPTPLATAAWGLGAGIAGTTAMTAYQTAVAKSRGTEPSTTPAEVAKRIIGGVLHRRVSDDHTTLLNNAMHWTYGTSWGALYGLSSGAANAAPLRRGLVFGAIVWGASLIQLPAMKLAPPVWEYPPAELGLDVSYHLVYGAAVATAYAVLSRTR